MNVIFRLQKHLKLMISLFELSDFLLQCLQHALRSPFLILDQISEIALLHFNRLHQLIEDLFTIFQSSLCRALLGHKNIYPVIFLKIYFI